MTDLKRFPVKSRTASDAVIDGLIAGAISGFVMLALILAGEILVGVSPAQALPWFVPAGQPTPLLGGLVLVAVSAIYGMAFGWIWHGVQSGLHWKIPTWLLGLAYGMAIFFVGVGVILPGINSDLTDIPSWLFGLAHAVYGLLLGWLVGRK